jgi:lysozyme
MKTSAAGLKFIMDQEGVELHAYRDQTDHLTIGVGHLLTPAERAAGAIWLRGERVSYGHGLTRPQVMDLLAQDLARFEAAVARRVTAPLTQNQFDVLVDFLFNCGEDAGHTLVQLLNEGNYQAVPGQLRQWVHSGGARLPVLARRREAECRLWDEA